MQVDKTTTTEDHIDQLNGVLTTVPSEISEDTTIMSHSISLGKLAESLAKAQSEMTMVETKGINPFFNSKYATLASVLEVALPALNKHGIALVQGARWENSTNGFYITSMLLHSSGEWLKTEIRMPIVKKDAHGIGAAMTYGRRYLASSITGVAQADDDGNGAIKQPNKA